MSVESTRGPQRKVLVIDDDPVMRKILSTFLAREGYAALTASNSEEALLCVALEHPELVLSDINLLNESGLDIQAKIKEVSPDTPVIMVTAEDDMALAVQAMQQGAYDYLTKPVDFERLSQILEQLFATGDVAESISMVIPELDASPRKVTSILIGRSPGMIEIYKTIGSVSSSPVTVLIEGESGTGKELIAKAVHVNSPWKEEPFVAVNCTALTETLLESELFGHVKGSFTGAMTDKLGKFELAGRGTIFLDEIGEISQHLQVKLLRVLQQREFERVGGDRTIPMEARIVAATNRDLKKEVEAGKFREDLFYRLNVVCIHTPPLRERKEDIPLLLKHLLRKINEELHTKVWKLSEAAMQRILDHDWPGNVRELENVLTRAVVLCKSGTLQEDNLPEPSHSQSTGPQATSTDWKRTLADVELEHIARVLKAVGGNRTEAARILGISKQTLYSRLPKN